MFLGMKKTKKTSKILIFLAILLGFSSDFYALSYSDVQDTLSDVFSFAVDSNEGGTTFRSLLIPYGGRSESMGSAYTGLSDDISYLQYNPAAGSIQKETQLSAFHNSWIADSKLDSVAFTTRTGNFSWGTFLSCFYVPFTEYNLFGDRVASSYYSETVAGINGSYNFLAGYNFKGFAIGGTFKSALRGMPDYTDNNTNEIINHSGFAQSAVAFMGDVGLMMQFNFLKFYSSRDPNVRIGASALNVGAAFTGLGSEKGIQIDDGLPTLFCAGISLRPIKPLLLSADFKQPVNFFDINSYLNPYFQAGVAVQFTSFLSLLGGFELKGGNPKISAGFEFETMKVRFNVNYSLDLTTSFNPVNKISLSAKVLFGDKGRSIISDKVDELYKLGLIYYSQADWQSAIDTWNQALKLNKRFDPAILGIQSAQLQIDMFKMIEESLQLD